MSASRYLRPDDPLPSPRRDVFETTDFPFFSHDVQCPSNQRMCEPQTVKRERSPSHDSGVDLFHRGRCLALQQGNAARPSQCGMSVLCVAAHARWQLAGSMFVDCNTAAIRMVYDSPAGGLEGLGA